MLLLLLLCSCFYWIVVVVFIVCFVVYIYCCLFHVSIVCADNQESQCNVPISYKWREWYALKLFNVAERSIHQSSTADLNVLLKCRELQASVLHKYHRDLAKTNDWIAQLYASRGTTITFRYINRWCHL